MGPMHLPSILIRRFVADERGVFAVLFGLMAIVLVAVGGAVVDYVSLEQTRTRAQIALDAAALALHPQIYNASATPDSIRQTAAALVNERVGDNRIGVTINTPTIDRINGRLRITGNFEMPTYFVQLVGVQSLSAGFASEVVRGAVDVEVSVALDVTLSMAGQRLTDLKAAVRELVDTVVQDVQTPTYTKMALVPYSQAVNAGSYATALRGPIRGPRDIRNITWMANTTIRNIQGISRANEATVTSPGHGFNNGDWVYVWGVNGMGQVNNRAFQVTGRTTDTFRLSGVNSSNYGWYQWGGQVRRCANANCNVVVTSTNHGYSAGQYLHITDVRGMTDLNGQTFRIASTTRDTVTLSGTPNASNASGYVANTGKLHCTWQTATEGCTYFRFDNTAGGTSTLAVTDCVTERATNGRTDRPPTTTLMGRNYPEQGNGCTSPQIVPLTANKTALHNAINGLNASGYTSGSLGILWSWYMLSPNFGYVWPAASRPAAYRRDNLLKAAIIMTDGEFNTVHCQGAQARNSDIGSATSKITCDAPNGKPYAQARAYCDAMKAQTTGIVVYTVGFGINAGTPAADIMSYCATSPDNVFLAQNGAALTAAFRQIAQNISALRVAR